MKTNDLLILVACAGLLGGCAAKAPNELVNAREAYRRASTGIAAQAAPAELHVANLALAKAEKSFEDDQDSYKIRDLSYVAQRKSELAEATASISIEKKSQAQAKSDYNETQGKIVTRTKQELSQTRSALEASKRSGEMTTGRLYSEQQARSAAEQQTANAKKAQNVAEKQAFDAQAALAKLAMVKQEPRGMVITLTGSVLFASNQSELLPQGRTKINQLAKVLLANPGRSLIIEGHTDSQGAENYNLDLSQRRADTVLGYLVNRGYQANRIDAQGLGEGYPIADNSNAEGRANNRRVEIIIENQSETSNQ